MRRLVKMRPHAKHVLNFVLLLMRQPQIIHIVVLQVRQTKLPFSSKRSGLNHIEIVLLCDSNSS